MRRTSLIDFDCFLKYEVFKEPQDKNSKCPYTLHNHIELHGADPA